MVDMDLALMFHHFRALALWLLPFAVILYVALDYLGFEKQRRQRVKAVEELLRLGFGDVYPSDNTHTAAALLGDATAQESVAKSFGGDVDDITYGELDLPSIAKLLQELEPLPDVRPMLDQIFGLSAHLSKHRQRILGKSEADTDRGR